MALLKEDTVKRKDTVRLLSSIIDHLDDLDSRKSKKFAEWLLRKSKYYKSHLLKKGFGDAPSGITHGDIVRVDFGINVGDEYSDENQDCHFGLVWARQGFLLTVIPLTKVPQHGSEHGINLGSIPELPENVDTWAKLEGIRSVSIRRIKRMDEFDEGKFSVINNTELMKKVKLKMVEKFFLESETKVLTESTK